MIIHDPSTEFFIDAPYFFCIITQNKAASVIIHVEPFTGMDIKKVDLLRYGRFKSHFQVSNPLKILCTATGCAFYAALGLSFLKITQEQFCRVIFC